MFLPMYDVTTQPDGGFPLIVATGWQNKRLKYQTSPGRI